MGARGKRHEPLLAWSAHTYEAADHVEHVDKRQGHDAARNSPLQLGPRDAVAHWRNEGHL